MKNFIDHLRKRQSDDFFKLDNYQNKLAMLQVWGNQIDNQMIQHEPTRHKMIVFILVERGYIDMKIDYKEHRLEANTFLHITPAHVIENIILSPDLQLYMAFVSEEFLHENRQDEKPFPIEYILAARRSPAIPINEESMSILLARLKGLQYDIRRIDHLFQNILIKNDFSSFVFELGHIIHRRWKEQPVITNFNPKEEIMGQFMLLLVQNCKKEHHVSFYAERLCITPEHLSRVLKEVSGSTANKWIARVLITETKILLKNQERSIQQIADESGFSDQSAFSKFFKKNCGVSPLNYREEVLSKE